MAVESTLLSIILARMKRRQALARAEDTDLTRDLDESIRTVRRNMQLPWNLKKGTLRVFGDVLEYPVEDDYDELAYLDTQRDGGFYPARARFQFTSLQQFYENLDYRNDIAEIRDAGSTYLGVRYHPDNFFSRLLNGAEDVSYFSVSNDASAVVKETVVFKEGNASMRITVDDSLGNGLATIKNTLPTSVTDGDYKRKYQFKLVYLNSAPTSITLRMHIDGSNYLEQTGITTQFSGQPFKANDWNLVAMDLNTATATGTIDAIPTFTYEEIDLVGASSGTYYIDSSYLRGWDLMDFWYYSSNTVKTVSASIADQPFFFKDEVYSTDSALVCDEEWTDFFQYDAEVTALNDLKEYNQVKAAEKKRQKAWDDIMAAYPSLKPLMITLRYRHEHDLNQLTGNDAN